MAEAPKPQMPFVAHVVQNVRRILHGLEKVPWTVAALPMRLAGFTVFWRSGTVKLADWNSTLTLFRYEYNVPVLPPEIAAYLATGVEIGGAVLLLLGLATRLAVLALFGVITVIQVFVYPNAWPDHIQWFAFLLPLLLRGPGVLSCDALMARLTGGTAPGTASKV